MAHVLADRTVCNGYGNCASAAPGFFDLDKEDRVVVLRDDIAQDDADQVLDAVQSCPTGALEFQD